MNLVTKLLRVVHALFRRSTWRVPRRAEVLVFEFGVNQGFDIALQQLLKPYTVERLSSLRRDLNIPVLMVSLFRTGDRKNAYYDQYIERVKPKLLLTYMDNNSDFYSFSARNQQIKAMFVQNGSRGYHLDVFEVLDKSMFGADFKVDYMLTHGGLVSEEYSKYIRGLGVPIGSFMNNEVPVTLPKNKGTLAYISQYSDAAGLTIEGMFYPHQLVWEQAERLIVRFLVEYAKSEKRKFYIIPRFGLDNDPEYAEREKNYYNRISGSECTYTGWQWFGSSYDAVDAMEVVVAMDSTMGLEAMARGTRAALFQIRSSLVHNYFQRFGWPGNYPDDGPFWTNRPDPTAFGRVLDHLFAISDDEWRAELQLERFGDLLQYDPGNSILRGILQSELGPGMDRSRE